jgi:hemerythrin
MAYFTWDDSYSVGVKEFDDHHKRLMELINQLHDAMRAGKAAQELGPVIDNLLQYTDFHFSAEEARLAALGYPALRKQKTEHEAFKVKVVDFRDKALKGQLGLSIEVSGFLKEWLTTHIKVEDKKYEAFCKSKNVS